MDATGKWQSRLVEHKPTVELQKATIDVAKRRVVDKTHSLISENSCKKKRNGIQIERVEDTLKT